MAEAAINRRADKDVFCTEIPPTLFLNITSICLMLSNRKQAFRKPERLNERIKTVTTAGQQGKAPWLS